MNDMNLRFNLADICYPDSLQDHHNGDKEQLIGVCLWASMSDRDLVEEILDETLSLCDSRLWDVTAHIGDEDLRVLLRQLLADELLGTRLPETEDSEDGDSIYCYGYWSWG